MVGDGLADPKFGLVDPDMARLILRLTDGLMTPIMVCWILMVWFIILWLGVPRDGLVDFEMQYTL